MRRRRHPGGRPKLNDRQPGQIPELLVQGPAVCGFSGAVWTRAGVARVIEQEFGVSCGPSQWDGSCGAAAGAGRNRRCVPPSGTSRPSGTGGSGTLPNSKNAPAEGRTIRWADASGFYLLPALLRTPHPVRGRLWAPVAPTPVIRRQLSYDQLSAISAINLTGDLYPGSSPGQALAVQDHSYRGADVGADVIGFLEQLLAEIPGKLLVIWDGAPIHSTVAERSRSIRPRARRGGSGWNNCLGMLRN